MVTIHFDGYMGPRFSDYYTEPASEQLDVRISFREMRQVEDAKRKNRQSWRRWCLTVLGLLVIFLGGTLAVLVIAGAV